MDDIHNWVNERERDHAKNRTHTAENTLNSTEPRYRNSISKNRA